MAGFDLDGSKLLNTLPGISDWPAVWVQATAEENIESFMMNGCDIHDWHDGVKYKADKAEVISGGMRACTLRGYGPIGPPPAGHAGIWLLGSGQFELDFLATTFRDSHDALELVGESEDVGEDTFTTRGIVSFSGCHFHDNENGLEFVGTMLDLALNVDSSLFCRSFSKGTVGWSPITSPCGAIVLQRPNQPPPLPDYDIDLTVRSCDFRKNAWALIYNPSSGTVDLGTNEQPGLNNFCIDFSGFATTADPLAPWNDPMRVQVYSKYTGGAVEAAGNYWVRSNQGADANGLLIGSLTAGVAGANLWPMNPFGPTPIDPPRPPGPQWGEFKPGTVPPVPFERNFSLEPTIQIHLGTQPAPLPAPSCATSPCPIDNP